MLSEILFEMLNFVEGLFIFVDFGKELKNGLEKVWFLLIKLLVVGGCVVWICVEGKFNIGCKEKNFLYWMLFGEVEEGFEVFSCWMFECGDCSCFCCEWVRFICLDSLIFLSFCCGGGKWGLCNVYFNLL